MFPAINMTIVEIAVDEGMSSHISGWRVNTIFNWV